MAPRQLYRIALLLISSSLIYALQVQNDKLNAINHPIINSRMQHRFQKRASNKTSPAIPPAGGVKFSVDQSSKSSSSFCPELIGAPQLLCNAGVCGGEDNNNKGHCKNKLATGAICQCQNGAVPSKPVMTTVTATSGDQQATGTFSLESISSLSSLRQSFTTTVETAPTGEPDAGAAIAIVFAGGVVWTIYEIAGDAAIAETIDPPAEPEGHDDDKTCPDPQTKCGDCAAVSQMCTTGGSAGCACDDGEEQCPSKDDLLCEDDSCKGDNGDPPKCTNEHKGCECDPTSSKCPDGDDYPYCSDCGGDEDKYAVCKDSPKGSSAKDCPCSSEKDDVGVANYTPYNPSDLDGIAAAINGLPDFGPDDWSGGGAVDHSPTCQKSLLAAPQRDEDGKPSVASSIEQWCSSVDGKTVSKSPGVDTLFAMFPVRDHSFWLSASNWYDAPPLYFCQDQQEITKKDCTEILTNAMIGCDPNSGDTHGATMHSDCVTYSVTIDVYQLADNPPWNRHPLPDPKSTCNKLNNHHQDPDQNWLNSDTAYSTTEQFCHTIATLPDPQKGGSTHKESYYHNAAGSSDMTLTWPGTDADAYPPLDENRCKDVLRKWLDVCAASGDDNPNNLKPGGTVDDQGFKYTLTPTGLRAGDPGSADADCHVWQWSIFNPYYDFRVNGRGYADSDWGQNTVLPNLRGCGVVTDWTFDYYCTHPSFAQNGFYEWFAAGKLPLGPQISGCVKSAMLGAGAKNVDDCSNSDLAPFDGLCPT